MCAPSAVVSTLEGWNWYVLGSLPRAKMHSNEPTVDHLWAITMLLSQLTVGALIVWHLLFHISRDNLNHLLTECGVAARRLARTTREIERKSLHLCGLLVPLLHQLLLEFGVAQGWCAALCWQITVTGWITDGLRVWGPPRVRDAAIWRAMPLREHEKAQLSGCCYFSLGCTIAITFFPPAISTASILFLVLGDMSAALIGVAFGGESVTIKLGREGKKSVEGSAAMFVVCFVVSCSLFARVSLCEYAAFFGALAATLTELYEPFHLNDNLTIPVFSSIALALGFSRTLHCESESPLLLWQ